MQVDHALLLIAGCWCDEFCATAGDCCDACPASCGTGTCRARSGPPRSGAPALPADNLFVDDIKIPPRARNKSSALFTADAFTFERELSCAADIERNIPFTGTAKRTISVVYVSARINGAGGVLDQAAVTAAFTALNAAYGRAGYAFTLAETLTHDFTTLEDAGGNDNLCTIGQTADDSQCQRCDAYKKANPNLQNPRTLFIYGVAASGEA